MSWPLVKLGDVCDLQNGYAFKSEDYVDESNTLSCRMSNIRPGGQFDINYSARYLPDSFADKHSQFLLADGDVVIAMTDLANEPKILGVPTVIETQGKNILLNQRVGKLVIKNSKDVCFPYLKLVLNESKVRSQYKKFAGGGLQINLGKNDLLSVEIPLPPLEEQKRIAAILDKADAIRRKRQQTIKLADDFLRSVFLEMFGDPVTNPKGWEVKRIGDFLSVKNGYAFKSEHFSDEGDFVLLTPGNFHEEGGYRDRGVKQKFYSGPVSDGFILKSDDILVAMTEQAVGLLGSSLVVPSGKTYLHNQRLGLLAYDCKVVKPDFLSYLFNSQSIRKMIHSSAIGLKVRHTSSKKIEKIEIGFPDFRLQEKFSGIVEKTKPSITKMNSLNLSSTILFNSLSQKAFSGAL